MIKTLRRSFTVTAMTAITVLLLVLLGGINLINAYSVRQENRVLLEQLCASLRFAPTTDGLVPGADGASSAELPAPPEFAKDGLSDAGAFSGRERHLRGFMQQEIGEDQRRAALFFTAAADSAGSIESVDLNNLSSIGEDEARALAAGVDPARQSGSVGAWLWQRSPNRGGGSTLVFLHTGGARNAMLRMAVLSLLGGAIAWGLMLLLVLFLSRKSIQPIAANMERQKRFVTDAGHELKTPLAIILANTEAMELRQGESKYSRNIRAQVERLSGLTQNLLALARADEWRVEESAEDFDLGALTDETARAFRESAELRGLTLVTDIAPGVEVHGSRQQLGQLIGILLDNAVKYCADGGTIRVALKKEGGKGLLCVRNTVSDQSVPAERLFDRFYRADESRSTKTGGFGIGLSAAMAIAESHRARLTAAYEGDEIVFTLKI